MAGLIVVLLLFAVSLMAPFLTPYDPSAINAWDVLQPPFMETLVRY
jgi:peptide/nickel transport system permease protein